MAWSWDEDMPWLSGEAAGQSQAGTAARANGQLARSTEKSSPFENAFTTGAREPGRAENLRRNAGEAVRLITMVFPHEKTKSSRSEEHTSELQSHSFISYAV